MLEMIPDEFEIDTFVSNNNQVKYVPIDKLFEYHKHPFRLYTGERLTDMVESIRQNGILSPIIVQPLNNGNFEILSGHNRVEGAKQAGLDIVPAIIKENLSEDEAEMYVMETNMMQRSFSELLVSEQASILQYRNSKMFSQGKRNDILKELNDLENTSTYSHDGNKLNENPTYSHRGNKLNKNQTTMDKLGMEYSMSKSSVARILRINYLISPLKDLIDNKKLLLVAGVELSYINQDYQSIIFDTINTNKNHKKITFNLARKIRNLCTTENIVTQKILEDLLLKSNRNNTGVEMVKVSLQKDVFMQYFNSKTSSQEISETLSKALKLFFDSQK